MPQFIQQELGRGGDDRGRAPRGWRMNRDDDDDQGPSRGGGLPEGHPTLRSSMMGSGMMMSGGARFHMRKGDSEIDVRCPSDLRMGECVDAIGRMLDRLSGMSAGSSNPTPSAR